MDFRFSLEDERFRTELLSFLKSTLPQPMPFPGEMTDEQEWELTTGIRRKLAEKGWLTMNWPEIYGGQAASSIRTLIFNEEMSYHLIPGRDVFGSRMLGPTLMIYGSEEQKEQFLPPISEGSVQWCQGYSEPESGSDLASLRTRAEDIGDHYLVNGGKIWTSMAHKADWMMLLARTNPNVPKHRGISFFLLDMRTDGIEIKPIINMAGRHEFNQIFFDNVRIPKDKLVGEEGQGWYVAVTLLDFERSGIDYAAQAKRLLDDLTGYVIKAQEAGNHRLSKWWINDLLAKLYIDTEVAKLISYRTAWLQSQHIVPTKEASMSKVFGSETFQKVAAAGLKILGLYAPLTSDDDHSALSGYVQECWRYSFMNTIAAGTSEIQRNIIANRGLKLPRN
ncbi:uncharacterized protein METZ01_LOCUS156676 [marine metagenome]|uniref:Acyl-CoA dehydrogenase n=1 Tax=marine metagenome TaxID=408172 RepID=A0A382ARW0_9ZZZZ